MRGKMLVLVATFVLLCASFAIGAREQADVSAGESGIYSDPGSGSYVAGQGNVTAINLTGSSTTDRWQGFYGNTTANLFLGAGTEVMYDFGSTNATAVYATVDQTFDFTSLQAATPSDADADTAWDFADGVDQVEDVYTSSGNSYDTDVTNAYDVVLNTNFNAYIATDSDSPSAKGDFAFGGEVVNPAATGFGGSNNYEVMVPTDGSGEEYFFFMSI
ncbi:MAG: hypothetical protein ACQESF_06310 [Nanobdellota archaeon]